MIYLDNASSTRLLPEVRDAMAPFLDAEYGNASSLHAAGRRARRAVEDARETVASSLGVDAKEIVFTSGATESNALAIEGVSGNGGHVVTSAVEHPSVAETLAKLEKTGVRVARVGVDGGGPRALAKAVAPDTTLVSVMTVNNEVGTVQPVAALREAAGKTLFHTDAAQALGKVAVETRHVDLMTFSGHKIHGPKGVGALWIRKGTPLSPRLVGGGQEFERRAGTENVAGIVGMAEAVRRACADRERNAARMAALRERLWTGLEPVGGARLLGDRDHRAPHLLNVAFERVDGESAILALDAEGVCVSSGSACASLSMEPSPVLRAMGVDPETARTSIRFGLSALTTEEEIDSVVRIVPGVIGRLRRISAAAK